MSEKNLSDEDSKAYTDVEAAQKLKELIEIHRKMAERLIRLQHEQERSVSDLKEVNAESKEEHGTDNLEDLREIVRDRRRENTKNINEFEVKLKKINRQLSDLEQ